MFLKIYFMRRMVRKTYSRGTRYSNAGFPTRHPQNKNYIQYIKASNAAIVFYNLKNTH